MAETLNILSKTHNIILMNPASIPKHLKRQTQIFYLPGKDLIVLIGWGENTPLVTELIAEHLELTPNEHERALKVLPYLKSSDMLLGLWETLEKLYQIRIGNCETSLQN